MNRLMNFLGMSVGGWIGWQLGALVSFFTAFMISMVGTGLGLYGAYKLGQYYLP